MVNNNQELNDEDRKIIDLLKEKNHIIIINKSDLESKISKEELSNIVEISVKNNVGIDKLEEKIKEIFNLGNIETDDLSYLSSARSISLLKKSLNNLLSAENGIDNDYPIDMVEIDIKEAWNTLGEIIGETYEEELLDQLFTQFCLGK